MNQPRLLSLGPLLRIAFFTISFTDFLCSTFSLYFSALSPVTLLNPFLGDPFSPRDRLNILLRLSEISLGSPWIFKTDFLEEKDFFAEAGDPKKGDVSLPSRFVEGKRNCRICVSRLSISRFLFSTIFVIFVIVLVTASTVGFFSWCLRLLVS